jgi:hypothetical protein
VSEGHLITKDELDRLSAGYLRLNEMEIKLKELTGNGKPGRVAVLESRMNRYDKLIWLCTGALIVLTPIVVELARQYIAHLWK